MTSLPHGKSESYHQDAVKASYQIAIFSKFVRIGRLSKGLLCLVGSKWKTEVYMNKVSFFRSRQMQIISL
jgi:hypothetical protein